MQYDIFISYRRDGGDMLAHILYERLTKLGYSVFQDIESLRSGKFNTAIYEKIESCKDFILVLPPKGLDRCVDEEDWVRKEIVCALKNHKNIIPVMLRGFEWPEVLPKEIDEIRYFNGLAANTEYFDQFIEKLTVFFETKIERKNQKALKQKHSIRTIAVILLILICFITPIITTFVFHMPFGLKERLIYFISLLVIAYWALSQIETRPSVAAACFGTLKEEDLNKTPDFVFSQLAGVFGKKILISRKKTEEFDSYYVLKRLEFGSWDQKRVNYLKIRFERKLEYYDPSVFYLHALSKGGQAVKMLTRQGFILQSTPEMLPIEIDYMTKNDFHVFLRYRRKRLDQMVVYQCSEEELKEKFEKLGGID